MTRRYKNGQVSEWFPARGGSAVGGKEVGLPANKTIYYVYILKSLVNGKHYIGYTHDIFERLKMHNIGKVRSTKAYKPYKLIYKEEFDDKTIARRRELFLKSGCGRDFIKSLLSNKVIGTGVRVV